MTDYRHLCGSESRRANVLVGIMSLSLLLAGLGGRRSQLNLGCSVARALVTGSGEDPWSALISLARLAESTVMIRVHHSRTITNFRFCRGCGMDFHCVEWKDARKTMLSYSSCVPSVRRPWCWKSLHMRRWYRATVLPRMRGYLSRSVVRVWRELVLLQKVSVRSASLLIGRCRYLAHPILMLEIQMLEIGLTRLRCRCLTYRPCRIT